MKKLILFFLTGIIISSCKDAGTESREVVKDTASATPAAVKMNYPYTIDHPDNWDMYNTENTMAALSALKAYENGNIDECVKYFGDSVDLAFDSFEARVSNDSLKAIFSKDRKALKSMEIKMEDWESVISKNKKAEYVSLWYKEIWEDAKGKKDSLSQMDDLRMKNGKIVAVDEKSRKYLVKKMPM